MSETIEKFLRYVKIDTKSDETTGTTPSTDSQYALADVLVKELEQMGAEEITYDRQFCYIYASIPATKGYEESPVLGFIAHMDTSPAVTGAGVNPRIVEDYDGKDIVLHEEKGIVFHADEFPEVKKLIGKDLIVTDGTTLLGADDKAGIAEIMAMAEYLLRHPEISHGKIRIGFTPDEEIGEGADHFDVTLFGADFAYTVDGGELGELEDETFNAAGAKLTVHGRSVHPGSAKGKMINAILIAQEFQSLLPAFQNPMYTEGYEGFFHLDGINGNVEKTIADYIIRDHDKVLFEQKKELFKKCADFLNEKYGQGTVSVEMKDSYYNMKEVLKPYSHLMENASRLLREMGVEPKISPVRGGTDGARLSYMGIPCPNLCTGGANYHSRFEYACVQSMETVTELLIKLAECYGRKEEKDLQPEPPSKEPERQYFYISRCKKYIQEFREKNGRPPTCCVTTFGCQMNARDSEKLTGILREVGYEIIDSEKADFVIFNTCTVRDNANQRVYGRLGELNGYKRRNPQMKIALCGCMMQEQAVLEKLQKSYSFVDLIFGTHNIYKFAELLCRTFEERGMIIDIWQDTDKIVEDLPVERKYPFKSGINIMFGCNNFCSYCIVPYVRGRERSREPKDILREIEKLVADGVVEIMLLGQNVNSYGKNLENPVTFAELLRQIEKIEGLQRIRFMTSHPKDLSDELIRVMKESKKICRHLHLPLQSGSTEILTRMNRRYTKEQYLELADKIRREIPDIALTTDIIVGFPGETEEDVNETIDVIRKVKFDNAFTFIYSKRTGTPAAAMENQVPEEQVKAGFDRVLKEVQETARMQVLGYQGMVMEALIEEVNENDATLVTGRLSNNTIVHLPGTAELIGKIIPVSLDECRGFYYMGHRI